MEELRKAVQKEVRDLESKLERLYEEYERSTERGGDDTSSIGREIENVRLEIERLEEDFQEQASIKEKADEEKNTRESALKTMNDLDIFFAMEMDQFRNELKSSSDNSIMMMVDDQSFPVDWEEADDHDILDDYDFAESDEESYIHIDPDPGPGPGPKPNSQNQTCHVFVDNSNLIYNLSSTQTQGIARSIWKSLIQGKQTGDLIIAGSFPKKKSYWNSWENLGFRTKVINQAGPSRKEEVVDEFLHAQIQSRILESEKDAHLHTLVIITGDGNINNGFSNFPKVITYAARKGFNIIISSWKNQCSQVLLHLQKRFPSTIRMVYLDKICK